MKKLLAALTIILSIGLFCAISKAESFAVGEIKLSAATIELDQSTITATGKASLTAPKASLKADSIKIELAKGKDKKLAFEKATASGNVDIKVIQPDSASESTRTVIATGDKATMVQSEETVVLTGNVEVKISDPQLSEPAMLSGDKVTIFLKTSKIQVQRGSDKPSEIRITPKEKK